MFDVRRPRIRRRTIGASLEEAASTEEDSPGYRVARELMSGDRWAEAAEALESLAKAEPNSPAVQNDLGIAYLRLGDSMRARAAFQAA